MLAAIIIAGIVGYGAGAGVCSGLLVSRTNLDIADACFTSIIWPIVLPFLATMQITGHVLRDKNDGETACLPDARVHRK